MIFQEVDYDKKEIRTYKRIGECSQCGECCKYHVVYAIQKPKGSEVRKNIYYKMTNEKGLWSMVIDGGKKYAVRLDTVEKYKDKKQCSELENNKCNKHKKKKKLQLMCCYFPMSPVQLSYFPKCSYRFELVDIKKIRKVA